MRGKNQCFKVDPDVECTKIKAVVITVPHTFKTLNRHTGNV